MAHVLYIHANIKPAGTSRSKLIADTFIEQYRALHPEDTITELDLYKENIDFLRPEDLMLTAKELDKAGRAHTHLGYADQFAEADKYIFATPMWNLGTPAIVKAYFDYVMAAGITFAYTAEGPVGLLSGKKALHINARGGAYSEGPANAYELSDRYLQTIVGFMGVTDYTSIIAEGLDSGGNVEEIIAASVAKLPLDTF